MAASCRRYSSAADEIAQRIVGGCPDIEASLKDNILDTRPRALTSGIPNDVRAQLDEWSDECIKMAEAAPYGKRAYSYSIPVVLASQRGQVREASRLAGQMCQALAEESAKQYISPAFEAWMLGRLLLASEAIRDHAMCARFDQDLSKLLLELVEARAGDSEQDHNAAPPPSDVMETWAAAYLMMHRAGPETVDFGEWLHGLNLLWGDTEAASAMAAAPGSAGSRMWCNVLTLAALARLPESGTALAAADPLVSASLDELYEDACLLFCYRHNPATPMRSVADLLHAEGQLSFADALRQIPSSDFPAWAVGMTRLAIAHRGDDFGRHGDAGGLDKAFREAMGRSEHPGDKALGVVNYMCALQHAEWRSSGGKNSWDDS